MNGGTEDLRRRLLALGFDEVRFTRVPENFCDDPNIAALRRWLDAGRHADMAWIERGFEKRAAPGRVLAGARSMILLGVNYLPATARENAPQPAWARYAQYSDYHDTIKPALENAGRVLESTLGLGSADYRHYVDTGPVLERAWAERAGLGFIGKNAMLISQKSGNWLFLAAILVRADLAPDAPLRDGAGRGRETRVGLRCGKCTRCIDACPTGAIASAGIVDSRRCISYLTIENKDAIPREFREAIGARIYGCDVCAEVCPWNRFAQAGRGVLLDARPEIAELSLREILSLTPESFAAVFRKTAVKRIKLAGLLRNACVAAGNSGDISLLHALARLAAHESPLVRAHAVWAVFKIAGRERGAGLLRDARARETDADVIGEYDVL